MGKGGWEKAGWREERLNEWEEGRRQEQYTGRMLGGSWKEKISTEEGRGWRGMKG